ncbi:MAG: YIP1 family protein [Peptococcaceae bacterium]|nr:YIP1 family protein [Peptococcaceae bacterium]
MNENIPEMDFPIEEEKNPLGFLELIYGIIFEPGKTFQQIAERPPLNKVLIIFLLFQALSMVLFIAGGVFSKGFSAFSGAAGMGGTIKALLFIMAFAGFILSFVKWLMSSAVIFFLSDLLGGRGKSSAVLAVTGLAFIPAMIISPLQLWLILMGSHWWSYVLAALTMIGGWCWVIVLLIIGLRETQHLSNGKSIAVIFMPVVLVIGLVVLLLIGLGSILLPVMMSMPELAGGVY